MQAPSEEIYGKSKQLNIMLKSKFSGLQRGRWQYGSIFSAPPLFDAPHLPLGENPSEFLDETYSTKTENTTENLVKIL